MVLEREGSKECGYIKEGSRARHVAQRPAGDVVISEQAVCGGEGELPVGAPCEHDDDDDDDNGEMSGVGCGGGGGSKKKRR